MGQRSLFHLAFPADREGLDHLPYQKAQGYPLGHQDQAPLGYLWLQASQEIPALLFLLGFHVHPLVQFGLLGRLHHEYPDHQVFLPLQEHLLVLANPGSHAFQEVPVRLSHLLDHVDLVDQLGLLLHLCLVGPFAQKLLQIPAHLPFLDPH